MGIVKYATEVVTSRGSFGIVADSPVELEKAYRIVVGDSALFSIKMVQKVAMAEIKKKTRNRQPKQSDLVGLKTS